VPKGEMLSTEVLCTRSMRANFLRPEDLKENELRRI